MLDDSLSVSQSVTMESQYNLKSPGKPLPTRRDPAHITRQRPRAHTSLAVTPTDEATLSFTALTRALSFILDADVLLAFFVFFFVSVVSFKRTWNT